MCGIAGAIGDVAGEPDVRSMVDAIKHRGPDDQGFFSSPGVALGMCRLAIQDLSSAGHQPMTSLDGRYTTVFNGEIYNVRELRDELAGFGVRFRGTSDTEVLVEGFARWGRGVLDRLRGMWAVAVFDRVRRELLLARDPFGIKPLYVYDDAKLLAFASEIKGLRAHPEIGRELDGNAIHDVLLLGYPLAPRTILRQTRAVLPGEEVTIRLDDRNLTSIVVPLTYDAGRGQALPTDDELCAALEDSVRHHLVADVPVGLFYSGGLDSTALAALLKRVGADLTAYHVAIDGRPDTPYARDIARALGVRMVEVPFAASDVPRLLDRFWNVMDQPLADTGLFPTMLVAERAARDVKVVLAGEGGDELFAGYDRHARLARITPQFNSIHYGTGLLAAWRTAVRGTPGLVRFLPRVQGALRVVAVRSGDLIGVFFSEVGLAVGLLDDRTERETIHGRLRGRETPDGSLAPDRLMYLPDDLLAKTDVATMSASLEARVPFLDREVFRLVAATPIGWRRPDGVSKAPLRRLLESQGLPRGLLDRPKAGFSVPLAAYILNHERDRIHDALRWYLAEYAGVEPALAAVFRWGLSSASRYDVLRRTLGYTLYALLTVYQFAHR